MALVPIKEIVRRKKRDARVRNAQQERRDRKFPEGRFEVIYADPPWSYNNTGSYRESVGANYKTMSNVDICNLSDAIKGITAKDAVLFLWITSPLLPEAFPIAKAWGFTYRASMIWRKNRAPGIGWYVRTYHEILLICTNTNAFHPLEKLPSIVDAKVRKHSQKPEEFYEIIERMYSGPKIELFSRDPRIGWTSWGNEVDDANKDICKGKT